jgi:hypothetical protein
MRTRTRRIVAAISLLAASGILTSGPGTGCISGYVTESTFVTLDFCFIFDCQNGILGGTIDPCVPVTRCLRIARLIRCRGRGRMTARERPTKSTMSGK